MYHLDNKIIYHLLSECLKKLALSGKIEYFSVLKIGFQF